MSRKKSKEWKGRKWELAAKRRTTEHRINTAITTTWTAVILISTYPVMFTTDKDNGYMFRLVLGVHKPNSHIHVQIYRMWHNGMGYVVAQLNEVAGSISEGVIGIFHWLNPSGRTMVLRSIQLLTEMSTSSIYWGGKVAGAWGRQPCDVSVSTVSKSGSFTVVEPSGPVQACTGIAILWRIGRISPFYNFEVSHPVVRPTMKNE